MCLYRKTMYGGRAPFQVGNQGPLLEKIYRQKSISLLGIYKSAEAIIIKTISIHTSVPILGLSVICNG